MIVTTSQKKIHFDIGATYRVEYTATDALDAVVTIRNMVHVVQPLLVS